MELLFFQDNSPLRYEFDQLFSSLFKNAGHHVEIIEELARTKNGLSRSELAKSGRTTEGKELTKCLSELEQSGFIRKYFDFTKSQNGGIYQLVDSLSLFHLTFMRKNHLDSWMDYLNTPSYFAWCGLAFERVCLLHIRQIKSSLGIVGVSSNEFAWRSKKSDPGAQIDLLIDRKDDVINICEMKYTAEPFSVQAAYEKELIHKVEAFRQETGTKKSLHLTMISMQGVADNMHKNILVNILTGDDLFRDT